MSKKRDKEIFHEMRRREFLKSATCAALSAAAFSSTMANFRVAEASLPAAPTAYTDYRALVCVFLFGGNDSWNMVVPTDSAGYGDYSMARQNLAVPQANLLAINPLSAPAGPYTTYGFHPSCPELQTRFNAGNMAIIGNCGTLIEPTTQAAYLAGTANTPNQLFSHNSQTDLWQSLTGGTTGWAGRIAPQLTTGINAVAAGSQAFNMNISLRGTNRLQSGATSLPYNISSNGVATFTGLNTNNATNTRRLQAFNDLLTLAQTDVPLVQEYGAVMERARDTTGAIEAALAALPPFTTTFPNTSIGRQLEMTARLIAIRGTLTVQRQIFYVGTGGYDTHGNQLNRHPGLLTDLSEALDAFWQVTNELTMQDNVTTFTNSEFGRTLTSNGDGSDHGWGGHSLVMGGCVTGQEIYGTMPELTIDGPDDTRSGRMIPTTPVDAFGATLCDWFGVQGMTAGSVTAASAMDNAFPNLLAGSFPLGTHDLGFMM